MNKDPYIDALIELHEPLERQGPGDISFSRELLSALRQDLPAEFKVAELGCGTGLVALMIAQSDGATVHAVDASSAFIQSLNEAVVEQGLQEKLRATQEDFSRLAEVDFSTNSYDLLWSEGAAYNLGFEKALTIWRPLLKKGGIAVVSELSWFSSQPSQEAKEYWTNAYPQISLEETNIERAQSAGFDVMKVERLPAKAWWDSYYNPLLKRMQQVRMNVGLNAAEEMYEVLDDTDKEIELFAQNSDDYGYSFYILKAR